jgi:hypothetical protein
MSSQTVIHAPSGNGLMSSVMMMPLGISCRALNGFPAATSANRSRQIGSTRSGGKLPRAALCSMTCR